MDAPDVSPIEEIARAISSHRFGEAYPHVADDVSWTLVGEARLEGKEAFIAACERTGEQLQGVATDFRHFRTTVADDFVVVDSVAAYTGPDLSTSVVASCDLYGFAGGKLTEMTSYNIELPDAARAPAH
jgi:SnoaL-like protein